MLRRGRLFLVMVVLAAVACTPRDPLAPDQRVAARQVEKLIPRGMSEARAKRLLTDRGFTLSRLSSDQAANHLIIATCTRDRRMWQVGLIIVDAHVAATSVTYSELDVLPR